MDKIDKSTAIPLGIAVSVTLFFMYSAIKISTEYAKMEANVSSLMRESNKHKDNMGSFRKEINTLNGSVIKLSQILKNLEEKIK